MIKQALQLMPAVIECIESFSFYIVSLNNFQSISKEVPEAEDLRPDQLLPVAHPVML